MAEAEGRAFADRGITDHRGGSREAITAATTRRLAAILAADVAGYSRLMGDEKGTLNRLKAHRGELVDPKMGEHHGRIARHIVEINHNSRNAAGHLFNSD